MPRAPRPRTVRRLTRAGLTAVTTALLAVVTTAPAMAAPAPRADADALSQVHELARFSLLAGQTPENVAVAADGSVVVSLALSGEVVRVSSTGRVSRVGQAPLPPGGMLTGVVVTPDHRVLAAVVGSAANMAALPGTGAVSSLLGASQAAGVWQLAPGPARRIAALPAGSMANGMTLDPNTGQLYVADSRLGRIWRIPSTGGTATPWLTSSVLSPTRTVLPFGPAGLDPDDLFPTRNLVPIGANGIKWHAGSIYVDNTSTGTLYRVGITSHGQPSAPALVGDHLGIVDDFQFIPDSATVLFARDTGSITALDLTTHAYQTVLSNNPALSTPTAIAVTGRTVYITNGAYFSLLNPNLTRATLTTAP
jgi:sugar lactone lactonase YvrE